MVVGIVCEYNPFHNGHLYHINKIREEFGHDTVIVAVMSGNFVQRGAVAIADKSLRAKCAVMSGVNLVLELPFPYSMSSAEFFASSAVHILNSLGCINYISFGSESGDIDTLLAVAKAMLSDEYKEAYRKISDDNNNKKLGHPQMCEAALKQVIRSYDFAFSFTPNNILAIEYLKALAVQNSGIKPHTVKRIGSDFDEMTIVPGEIQSATAIREIIGKKDISALQYIPTITKGEFLDAIEAGEFPCDSERLSTAIISSFRINPLAEGCNIHDAAGGLYNRLRDLSFETDSFEKLVCLAETKKFTRARIQRAIFYSLLSVTSSHVRTMPLYTQILALDTAGRTILKDIRKHSDFPILTKPSDVEILSDGALLQKELSDRADSVFQLTKPSYKDGRASVRFTPYVKK